MADDKIDYRSEKIRNIINEPPSKIICYGITIISIVLSVLYSSCLFNNKEILHTLSFKDEVNVI